MTNPEHVERLMGPVAWAALNTLDADRVELVEAALTEYPDPRNAAASLLDQVAADLSGKAAGAPAGTKRIKVGKIEIEKASSGGGAPAAQASAFAALAERLRREARRAARTGIILATPLQVPR